MSQIREYFQDKTVLLTGATGFLGKALVEKMLRSLPGIRRLYLLIRPRERGSETLSAAHRFRELLKSTIFDRFRRDVGEPFDSYVDSKVIVVAGDLTDDRFGLDEGNYRQLTAEVEVILNSAAVVVFDERLDLALNLNTHGAKRMLEFARACRRLEAVLHISTCYVSGTAKGWVREELRPLSFDVDAEAARLSEACAAIHRRHAQEPSTAKVRLVELGLQSARARGWHDTYTFTKALGEQMIARHRGDVPIAIVRPSIIESTFAEPEPGWIDGFRMGDPLFVGYGKGYLQDFPARPDTIQDLIPCDYVVNAILATAPRCAAERGLKIYQVATGEQNPAEFRTFYEVGRDYFTRNPMYERNGKPIPAPIWSWPDAATYRRKLYWKYQAPLSGALALLGPLSFFRPLDKLRKRLAVRRASLDLLNYYVDIYSPYTMIESRYATGNTAQLWSALSPEDRQLFNFDVCAIDWHHYIGNIHIPGLKRNVLNLTEETGGNGARPTQKNGALLTDGESESPFAARPDEEPLLQQAPRENGELQAASPQVNSPTPPAARQQEETAARWGKVLAPKTAVDDSAWLNVGRGKQAIRAVMRRLMRLYAWAWFGFEVRGTEHLPEGAFIVAANHCSHLDTGAVVTAFGGRGGELFVMGARDYFFNRKLRGWFFHTFLNVIPFDRTQNMIKGLRLAQSVLRSGRPLLIFPEGTRSKTGALQSFKPGIGLLGLELGLPIVPCHIEGTHAALPKGKTVPRRAKIRVTFAPPVTMEEYRAQHPAVERRQLYRRVAEDVRAVIVKMREGEG